MGVEEALEILSGHAEDTVGHLLGRPIRKRWFHTKLNADQKAELRALAVLAKLSAQGRADVPSWSDLVKLAGVWSQRMGASGELRSGKYRFKRPLVLWLVGTGISQANASPLDALNEWRRSGIDARYLGLDVRRHPSRPEWSLQIEREGFAERDSIEQNLLSFELSKQPAGAMAPVVETRFYQEASPSQQARGETLGLPLGRKATALVTTADGQATVVP